MAGKYPAGATPVQKQTLQDAVEAIQSDTGITFPDSMDVAFLEASRTGNVTHEQLCEFMDRQISKAVLGQTLTTEIKGEGSYAASQTHNEVRQEIIEADADLLDACLNEALIPWIVDLNFPQVAAYPKIKTYAGEKPDLTAQVTIDKTLVVDIGLPVGTAYFYETYGIPVPAEGEALVSPRQVKPQETPAPDGKEFSEAEGDGRDAADLIAEQTSGRGMAATDKIYMAPLKRLVDEARDLDDLRGKILDLWGEMDPEDLGVVMAQGMSLADMTGRFEVTEEGAGKKKA